MQDQGNKNAPIKRKPIKRNIKRKNRPLKDNTHVEGLEDYSEMTTQAYKKGS